MHQYSSHLAGLQVSEASVLAKFLVTSSMLFPAYRATAMSYDLQIGTSEDPTTKDAHGEQEVYILQLLRAAHDKARRIVTERRHAIEKVAAEMCRGSDDTISGAKIVEIIESTGVQEQPARQERVGNILHHRVVSKVSVGLVSACQSFGYSDISI